MIYRPRCECFHGGTIFFSVSQHRRKRASNSWTRSRLQLQQSRKDAVSDYMSRWNKPLVHGWMDASIWGVDVLKFCRQKRHFAGNLCFICYPHVQFFYLTKEVSQGLSLLWRKICENLSTVHLFSNSIWKWTLKGNSTSFPHRIV